MNVVGQNYPDPLADAIFEAVYIAYPSQPDLLALAATFSQSIELSSTHSPSRLLLI